MLTACVQSAVHSLFALETRCEFAVNSLGFFKFFLIFFMRGLCAVYMWLGQTSVNGNTTNLERVLYLCLTLDWRWSDVYLASIFKRGKNASFDARPANHNAQAKIVQFCSCARRAWLCDWAFIYIRHGTQSCWGLTKQQMCACMWEGFKSKIAPIAIQRLKHRHTNEPAKVQHATLAGKANDGRTWMRTRGREATSSSAAHETPNRPSGYERVYLPLCEVADTPFHIQGDEMLVQRWNRVKYHINRLMVIIKT